jgi:hypothetical protein
VQRRLSRKIFPHDDVGNRMVLGAPYKSTECRATQALTGAWTLRAIPTHLR